MTAQPTCSARVAGTVLAVLALPFAGCGTGAGGSSTGGQGCAQGRGFSLSLARDTGGEHTPVAAATWFARHGEVGWLPRRGWHVVAHSQDGATVRAEGATVHVVQGSDGTWLVTGGKRCE